jgi:hypothetical protein
MAGIVSRMMPPPKCDERSGRGGEAIIQLLVQYSGAAVDRGWRDSCQATVGLRAGTSRRGRSHPDCPSGLLGSGSLILP